MLITLTFIDVRLIGEKNDDSRLKDDDWWLIYSDCMSLYILLIIAKKRWLAV